MLKLIAPSANLTDLNSSNDIKIDNITLNGKIGNIINYEIYEYNDEDD